MEVVRPLIQRKYCFSLRLLLEVEKAGSCGRTEFCEKSDRHLLAESGTRSSHVAFNFACSEFITSQDLKVSYFFQTT